MSGSIVEEKLRQAVQALNELDIDLWLLLARESDTLGDPSLPLVVGTSVTWESAFLISRTGEHRAVVGTGDVENLKQTGAWPNITSYVEGPSAPLREAIERYDPRSIALNYSKDNSAADGLTYGMFLNLQDILGETPYWSRIISGEPVASRVRSRKSPEEVQRMRRAVATTNEMWEALRQWLRPGRTEREIAEFMHQEVDRRGLGTAWDRRYCPSVTAGPHSPVGHTGPTDVAIQPGQLLSLDFGILQDDYTSDLQRTYYFLAPGETEPPAAVRRGFEIIAGAIRAGAEALKPGKHGWEVDAVARDLLMREAGAEWPFAFGHQMGRAVHDGGCVLGPRWERYGRRPYDPIEVGHVYTLEIGMDVPGFGWLALEDDAVVVEDGCEFLGDPQIEPILIQAG